jgi:ferredoxin
LNIAFKVFAYFTVEQGSIIIISKQANGRRSSFKMRVYVDQDLCISCGLCIDTAPAVFQWNDDEKAQAIEEEVPSHVEEDAREALENCPTDAIKEME